MFYDLREFDEDSAKTAVVERFGWATFYVKSFGGPGEVSPTVKDIAMVDGLKLGTILTHRKQRHSVQEVQSSSFFNALKRLGTKIGSK